MKKRRIILTSMILSLCFLLIQCGNDKLGSQSAESLDVKSIKVGEYFGKPYELTNSFIPTLYLEDNNTFKFDLAISKSIKGDYKIDNNKLVLNSYDGNESYTFQIIDNTLIIEQEILYYVKKNTKFALPEKQ